MSAETSALIEKLLVLVPGFLAAIGLGYKLGSKDKKSIENELMQAKLDLERSQNAEDVKKSHSGMSSESIVDAELTRAKQMSDP